MNIDHTLIIPLMREFAALTPSQQQVFLYCLVNMPNPKAYTSDLLDIRTALGCKPITVRTALRIISQSKQLSQLVKYHRVNHKEALYHEYEQKKDHLHLS